MKSISGIQQQHTNQYSLPFWTSSSYLKLWLCSRQIAQHISWSQGCFISPHISKQSSPPVWTMSDRHIISLILPFISINNNLLPYWRILGCFSINIIKFWDCPSSTKWPLHVSVDKDIKKFNLIPISPSKSS